jgi:tetratricopeptide (TPR) repeat protein
MAVTIEAFTVVVKYERVHDLLQNEALKIPNSTALADDHLWKISFMAETDAWNFLRSLQEFDLNVSTGPDSDAVLANEFDGSVEPYCEWLRTGKWEKAVIAWREGTLPETIIAPEGWDPKVGSGLEFYDQPKMQSLEFLRLEDNVEVFLNKNSGKEVYIGRTSTAVDSLFATASAAVRKYYVSAGQSPLTGAVAEEVAEAAIMLEKVIAEAPDWWNAQWFYGKSQLALGNHEAAYLAFQHAYRVEKNVEAVLRELAGVCLELRKFDEAVTVAEGALALDASNPELLGNLAVAYLLVGRTAHARKAIDTANKLNQSDRINRAISRVISEIETGKREPPQSFHDLSKPLKSAEPAKPVEWAKPVKRSFFKLPWKK